MLPYCCRYHVEVKVDKNKFQLLGYVSGRHHDRFNAAEEAPPGIDKLNYFWYCSSFLLLLRHPYKTNRISGQVFKQLVRSILFLGREFVEKQAWWKNCLLLLIQWGGIGMREWRQVEGCPAWRPLYTFLPHGIHYLSRFSLLCVFFLQHRYKV